MTVRRPQHLVLTAMALVATTVSLYAAENSVPVYPNAANRLQGVPAGAGLAQYETADSVDKVDGWYGAHLPKDCKHETAQGGAKYACPGTNVMITPDKVKTVLTHMAAWIGRH